MILKCYHIQLFCPQISFCPDVPIWGPYGSHMVYMETIWVPYGIRGSHMGKTRWVPDGPHGANGRCNPYGGSGPHVCPSGSHMGSPYGNHMVGEFCPDGNQMGPIFFATWEPTVSIPGDVECSQKIWDDLGENCGSSS